jgi:pimeloyl-ACP methyl ester carboxylesterase
MDTAVQGQYASVNGLEMYYEVHGEGRPLVVLHGAYMAIGSFGELVPALAESRQVIAVELQGHGHTADIDRPITYEGMADDVAALIRDLGLSEVDVYGYSMGGGVALQLVIRHPELVRKLVVVSAGHTYDVMPAELAAMFETITPEMFAGSPFEAAYLEVAPKPDDFPNLVEKLKQLDLQHFDWSEQVRAIESPVLLIVGDSDIVQLEYAVEMFKLLGGGVFGDMAPMPASQLAILPGTSHLGVMERVDWLVPLATSFLDAPEPDAEPAS